MPDCGNCGAALDDSYRFCPSCAKPQTDEARKRFNGYIEKAAERRLDESDTGGGSLETRLSYAVGYVSIVAGLATLLELAGVFFLVAGLLVLPPVRGQLEELVDRKLDRTLDPRPVFGGVGGLILLGAVVLVFV